MDEPSWITRPMLDAMQSDLLRRYGGLPGVNADGLISLSLSRPRDRWDAADEAYVDLPQLAAAYGYALVKNQGFRDGNARLAFLAMYVFLGLNDVRLVVDDGTSIRDLMFNAAPRGRERLTEWVRDHVEPR